MDGDDGRMSPMGAVVASVLGLLIGVFAGATTTLVHRQWIMTDPTTVPWGLVAGLAVLVGVLAGLRIVFDSRLVAGVAAVGALGIAALFALPSPGGSVVVVDDPLGWTWVIGSTVIALAVLVWPRPRRPEAVRPST